MPSLCRHFASIIHSVFIVCTSSLLLGDLLQSRKEITRCCLNSCFACGISSFAETKPHIQGETVWKRRRELHLGHVRGSTSYIFLISLDQFFLYSLDDPCGSKMHGIHSSGLLCSIHRRLVMARSKFEKLFTPGSIGGVKLKNRLVKTANQTYLVTLRRPSMAPWQRAARVW